MNHALKRKNGVTYCIQALIVASVATVFSQENVDSEVGTDMSLEDLVNVKVSVASKTSENVSDAPGVISVITQDQLKRFGGTTLGDILKRVPSFLGTTVYFTDRSVIASRGDQVMPSSSHILLLINGRPIREIHEGGIKSEVYESFPVNVIERIEVIRGPGSVLYGSQAFSAVINVVTKAPDKNCVTVAGAVGEKMHNNIMANVNYQVGDFGIVIAGRYADRSGWDIDWEAPNPASTGGVDTVEVSIPDYGPGAYIELSYKDLHIMGSYNEWNNENFVPDYQMFKGNPIVMPNGNATGRVEWKKMFADIGYKHQFTEWYNASLNATYTRSLLESKSFPWTARDAYEGLVEETNFFNPVDNLNILAGVVYGFMTGTESDARTDMEFNHDHKQNSGSGYLQIDYHWDWCKVIGGLQANKVEGFNTDYNPRFGLIFYPMDKINIKTLYSTAYRAPSLDELYLDHPTMRGQMIDRIPGDIIREKGLEPEKVATFDVGANYQDDKVHVGFNAFHSQMKNLIFQDRDPNHYAIPTWDNLNDVTIFGLECEGKYYLTNEWMVEGSFLYQQSEDDNTGEQNVTPLSNFSVKGGLSYKSEFGLTISVFNTFHQALDGKYTSTLNTTTEYYNMASIYCEYDLNKSLGTSFKEIALVVTVDNLLDEEVWLPAWGLKNGSRIPYNEGRTIYGGFKITY